MGGCRLARWLLLCGDARVRRLLALVQAAGQLIPKRAGRSRTGLWRRTGSGPSLICRTNDPRRQEDLALLYFPSRDPGGGCGYF